MGKEMELYDVRSGKRNSVYSEAFSLELLPSIADQTLYDNVVSYLGEYRFQVQKYRYHYQYSQGTDGLNRLRESATGEPMVEVALRGVAEKMNTGQSVHKVMADVVGLARIEQLMAQAADTDTILFASPPDPLVGYTYGFLYLCHVQAKNDEAKKLEITAVRLDNNPPLKRFNDALTALSGQPVHFETVNQFIEQPICSTKYVDRAKIDEALQTIFGFVPNLEDELIFRKVITYMRPQIREFVQLVKVGTPATQLRVAFNTLENYALDLKHRYSSDVYWQTANVSAIHTFNYFPLHELATVFGYQPPEVMGSCGSSGGRFSADIFGTDSIFRKPNLADLFNPTKENDSLTCKQCGEGRHFHCPGCNSKIPAGEGRTRCTNTMCTVTRENWSGPKCN